MITVAAIAETHPLKDSDALFPGAAIQWINDIPQRPDPAINAYVDLDFVPEPGRIRKLGALLPALVIVNAVIPTIHEIGERFVRLNAWPGFATSKIHELVTPDEATKQRIVSLYGQLDCTCKFTPDLPGMMSARIVAGIINEAWYTWQEKVSTKAAIDTAMRLGTNYPLGPFEWGERIGLGQVTGLLWSLAKSDPRYTPASSLQEAVDRNAHEEK